MNIEQYYKYDSFKSFLGEEDADPEDMFYAALKTDAYRSNVGHKVERIEHNEREMAFFEQWLRENEPRAGINNGHGILQDLFIEREGLLGLHKWKIEISNRERMIVATIIQWLGSNVGMGFLHAALARFGAHISYKQPTATTPKSDKEIEELAEAYAKQQYDENIDSCWPNDYNGFVAGYKAAMLEIYKAKP
jgi:hypothetical protein